MRVSLVGCVGGKKKRPFKMYESVLFSGLSGGEFQEQGLCMKDFVKESDVSSSSCTLLYRHGFCDSCGVSLLFHLPMSACLTMAFFLISNCEGS